MKKLLTLLKLLALLMACMLVLGLSTAVAAVQVDDEEVISLEVASDQVAESIEQNPISVPDWWGVVVDLITPMLEKAMKSGNFNVAITEGYKLGGYIHIVEGENINWIWSTNPAGNAIGIMNAKPFEFQKKITLEEFRNTRFQLLYYYTSGRFGLAITYEWR
ncbi:MAG: hypothetical protein ACTSPV_05235 [Candidatus Hodarchaeales archaeon]